MKLTHLVVAGTACLSLAAITTGAQARGTQAHTQAGQQAQAGHSKEVIMQVQEKLSAAGHDVGPADGIMGARTKAGLKAFQQSKGMAATGRLDQQTFAALGVEATAAGATPGALPERGAQPQGVQPQAKTPSAAPETGPGKGAPTRKPY